MQKPVEEKDERNGRRQAEVGGAEQRSLCFLPVVSDKGET